YSFANANYGQLGYKNSSELQSNFAPSLSSGFISENTGSSSLVHSGNETIYRQNRSDLRTSVMSDQSISQSFQHMRQEAESLAENRHKSAMETTSHSIRQMADFTTH